MHRRLDPAVVTNAPLTLEQERMIRQHRYMWTMGGRTVMFIIAIAVPMPIWARFILLGASMIVPWLAVMAANQPHQRIGAQAVVGYLPSAVTPLEPLQLDQSKVIDGDVA
jgi:hypothetical protein